MTNKVYVFQGEDENRNLITYIKVKNEIRDGEAIGTPKFLAGPIMDLISQGYEIILDRTPDGKRAKINKETRMDLGARLA